MTGSSRAQTRPGHKWGGHGSRDGDCGRQDDSRHGSGRRLREALILCLAVLCVVLLAPGTGCPAAAATAKNTAVSMRTGRTGKNTAAGTKMVRTAKNSSAAGAKNGNNRNNSKKTAGTAAGGQTRKQNGSSTGASVLAVPGERKVIFIGDSRTVGVYNAVSGSIEADTVLAADPAGDVWSARVSEGLWWVERTGVPAVEDQIDAATDVVICCGVNDVGRSDYVTSYAEYLNQKAAEWKQKGAQTYFVSVLPVRKTVGQVTNKRIRSSNQSLMKELSSDIGYIDLDTPFRDKLLYLDDLHYQPQTCQLLYQYLKLTLAADHAANGT